MQTNAKLTQGTLISKYRIHFFLVFWVLIIILMMLVEDLIVQEQFFQHSSSEAHFTAYICCCHVLLLLVAAHCIACFCFRQYLFENQHNEKRTIVFQHILLQPAVFTLNFPHNFGNLRQDKCSPCSKATKARERRYSNFPHASGLPIFDLSGKCSSRQSTPYVWQC